MRYLRIISSLMLLVIFVGCSRFDPEYIRVENSKKKVEVEFWYGMTGYSSELMKSYIDTFNNGQELYTVVGVEQSSNEETFKALKSAIARKKVPSVVLLENQHLYYLASKGVMDKVNDFNPDGKMDDFIESYIEQNKIKDNLMGIPMYGKTTVLYYRRDFFEEHHIKPVDLLTWEAVSSVASKLTQKDENEILVYGCEIMNGAKNLIDGAISNGGNFLSEDGREIMIDTKEWIEAWEFFRARIHDENLIKVHYGGDITGNRFANIDDIMQGRTAMYIGSCGDRGELDSSVIGTYLLPSWENKLDNPRAVVDLYSLSIPIYVDVREREGAMVWMNYLTSEEKSLDWLTNTGFLPVRKSSMDEDAFYSHILENPDYFIPISQVKFGTKIFIDPTDGKIYDALNNAAYKVLVENISAKEALEIAKTETQPILDEIRNQGR
jgi:multiple sugar transport system substrate-binding protein